MLGGVIISKRKSSNRRASPPCVLDLPHAPTLLDHVLRDGALRFDRLDQRPHVCSFAPPADSSKMSAARSAR